MPLDVDRILKPGGGRQENLIGRLLVIDQSEPARHLLAHDLSNTAIEVVGFACSSEAPAYLRTMPVTRVISDAATIQDNVETTMLAIREVDYSGPVLLMASDPKSPTVQAATKMGAGPLLTKPFDVDGLLRFVGDNWADGDEELIEAETPESTLAGLIKTYVSQVASLVVDLDAATLAADFERTLHVVQHLKGHGTTFGFPDLTAAATAAITALHASGGIPDAAAELRWLREACSQLRPEHSERLKDTYAIPLSARIVALADVFDALTSARVYKPAFETQTARLMIKEESGRHFDPAIVTAFSACWSKFVETRDRYSDSHT